MPRSSAARALASLLALPLAACAGPAPDAAPAPRESVRLATYNTEGLSRPGSPAWDALVAVLRRVDADILLLQEITEEDGPRRLRRLADAAGYPHHALSEIHGTLSGGLRAACLSRWPIAEAHSWSADELAGDPYANDIGRDPLSCRIETPSGPLIAITVHLKAGGGEANGFRRQVELIRLGQVVDRLRAAAPGVPLVVAGDFNEDPRFRGRRRWRYDAPPRELPRTFRLGRDIELPLRYEPFAPLERRGFELVRAVREDRPEDAITHPPTARRIDLVFRPGRLVPEGALVYDGCLDDGRDDPPPGDWLPLAGTPLGCDATREAADHLPVVADLRPAP